MVAQVLERAKQRGLIQSYHEQGSRERFDFSVIVDAERRCRVALEVKGGEGNSINISERPHWADEFIVWSHLDGAVVNQPRQGAHAIIFNRLSNEIVRRGKRVDALLIRDRLCGSRMRPCPKFPEGPKGELGVAPCVFLFPTSIPSLREPEPPVHTLATLKLPRVILQAFDVPESDFDKHLYTVRIAVFTDSKGRIRRRTSVFRMGELLEQTVARGDARR